MRAKKKRKKKEKKNRPKSKNRKKDWLFKGSFDRTVSL